MNAAAEPEGQQVFLVERLTAWQRQYQSQLDRTTPYTLYRWGATAGLLFLFMIRILIGQAYYIVTYALGIYLLNLFLAFLQPKFDPSVQLDAAEVEVEEGAPGLPTNANGSGGADDDEFRPFIRRLPEFRFWYSSTRAIVVSMVCTVFPIFDIPVYWPILLIYFFALFGLTMRRQIEHMRRYKSVGSTCYTALIPRRYVPWDLGKRTFGGKR